MPPKSNAREGLKARGALVLSKVPMSKGQQREFVERIQLDPTAHFGTVLAEMGVGMPEFLATYSNSPAFKESIRQQFDVRAMSLLVSASAALEAKMRLSATNPEVFNPQDVNAVVALAKGFALIAAPKQGVTPLGGAGESHDDEEDDTEEQEVSGHADGIFDSGPDDAGVAD
jgi:hypothetical protein